MKEHSDYLGNVKIGDKLWSIEFGWGIVSKILTGILAYPIEVSFDGTRVYYTVYGKKFFNVNPTLFFDEIEIPERAFIRKDPSSFKEFLETNGICFDKFIENCLTQNQRWEVSQWFYDIQSKNQVKSKFEKNKKGVFTDLFYWKHNIIGKSVKQLDDIDDQWKVIVCNYPEIPFE